MPAPIYLDYAATTPVDPRVADKLNQYLTMDGAFANPASRSHMLGWQAEAGVEHARKQVAELLNADVREIVWTSGATEANNLAIKSVLGGFLGKVPGERNHIVTSLTEHKAVIDCVEYLQELGFEVSWLEPSEGGYISAASVAEVVSDKTCLVSIMHVNNETGVINDVVEIAKIVKAAGALFHVDAAQSAGKLEIDTQQLQADFISVCAHKIYGPKGIGALYVRRSSGPVYPLIHGGGHERGMRSGTLATHQIVAMGEAFMLAGQEREQAYEKLARLKQLFLAGLSEIESFIQVNGDLDQCVPGILNLSFKELDGQLLLSALPQLAISSGSACSSATMSPSHVLKAMGLEDQLALSSLRFSFGRFTSDSEVEEAAKILSSVISKLKH